MRVLNLFFHIVMFEILYSVSTRGFRSIRLGKRMSPLSVQRALTNDATRHGVHMLLDGSNLKWTPYVGPYSKHRFEVAETVDIDPVINYTIENDLPEPFGIVTWNSSFVAADVLDRELYLLRLSHVNGQGGDSSKLQRHQSKKSNETAHDFKTVCDLGCGTCLTSLVCFSHGLNVKALDFNTLSLQLGEMSYNRYVNSLNTDDSSTTRYPNDHIPGISFHEFDMENADQYPLPACDILIISDVTYYEPLAVSAAFRAVEAIVMHDASVLITDPGRNTASTLLQQLQRLIRQLQQYQNQHRRQNEEIRPVAKGDSAPDIEIDIDIDTQIASSSTWNKILAAVASTNEDNTRSSNIHNIDVESIVFVAQLPRQHQQHEVQEPGGRGEQQQQQQQQQQDTAIRASIGSGDGVEVAGYYLWLNL